MKKFIKNTSIILVLLTLIMGPFGSINIVFAEEGNDAPVAIVETANSSTNATPLPKKSTTTTEEEAEEKTVENVVENTTETSSEKPAKSTTTAEESSEQPPVVEVTESTENSSSNPPKSDTTTEEKTDTDTEEDVNPAGATPATSDTDSEDTATKTPETVSSTPTQAEREDNKETTTSTTSSVSKSEDVAKKTVAITQSSVELKAALDRKVLVNTETPTYPEYCISSEIKTLSENKDLIEASRVHRAIQGLDSRSLYVRDSRSLVSSALPFELVPTKSDFEFYSLGFDGEIVLEFDNLIPNGAGDDVTVVEITWYDFPYPNESANVYASKDGIDWKYLGNASSQTRLINGDLNNYHSFDLGDLEYARFIKLIDTTSLSEYLDYDSHPESRYDGFDLNAVVSNQTASFIECENAPVITLTGSNPITITEGSTFTDPGATATDLEDGDLTGSIVVTGSVDTSVVGVYSLTYNVSDSDGNIAFVTRVIHVKSKDEPTCSVKGHKYDENGNPLEGWTIGIVGSDELRHDSGIITILENDPYIMVTDVTDENGEYCLNNYFFNINQEPYYIPEYWIFEESKEGWEPIKIVVNDEESAIVTSNPIIDVYTDITGLLSTEDTIHKTLVVDFYNKSNVVKNIPTITLAGSNPITLTTGSNFTDPGATANDIEDGDLTSEIVFTGSVNVLIPGTYTLTYTVTDSDNNTVSTNREVIIRKKVVEDDDEPTSGRRHRTTSSSGTSGEVLGTSIDNSSCGIYLHKWIKEDWVNDPVEVLKLQIFLVSEGFNAPINAVYDKATIAAVNEFQLAHKEFVLDPWQNIGEGDGTPTSFVYKTTQWMINEIVCPGIAPFPVLD